MQRFGIILVIVIIAGVAGLVIVQQNSQKQEPTETGTSTAVTNFQECVDAGNPVMESFPRQCRSENGETFTEDIGNLDEIEDVRIDKPRPNQSVTSPVAITGSARGTWYNEAVFQVRVLDGNGSIIAQGYASTPMQWMTEDFVPFRTTLAYEQPTTTSGRIEILKANPSGRPENEQTLHYPIQFSELGADATTVDVYFGTTGAQNCTETQSVTRTVPQTQAVARTALEALIAGPVINSDEESALSSAINPGSEIRELSIEDGVARVNFGPTIARDLGGSCRVEAIRAQITDTLTQFDTVDTVEIAVEGETEGVLQP
jgi:hypothetical protein